jgi:hypothetical protein
MFVVCSLQAERECEGAGQAGQRVDDHGSSAMRLRPCFWYVIQSSAHLAVVILR